MQSDLKALIQAMTLKEKASLCSGKDFWHLKGIERLGIPTIMVTDGPHGLRKQEASADHVGLNASVKATCFPTAVGTGSSWNVDLMHRMGVALGEACLQEDVAVLLGPGVNIKRSPLCGRNFEYISEDPHVTGEMAAALINGVQSQGVGTSLKHFAVNSQEYRRMTIDSVVDTRALHEIYLSGFETAVKKAQPWTVMCAYNQVNGTFCSDHRQLLTEILKEAWGHTGLVITDWGACNDRVAGIKAGMDLEMPASGGVTDRLIVEAVEKGKLDEADLDKVVIRILELIQKATQAKKQGFAYDANAHHALAREIAGESMVLLKNDDKILPLNRNKTYGVIGDFAKNPRYQGNGSSLINPTQLVSAVTALENEGIDFIYAKGFDQDTPDLDLVAEAVRVAKQVDVVLVFAGLPNAYESEGFDRTHLNMPKSQNDLIEVLAKVNANVVVALQNGAPVLMPWLEQVKGVLECYLGGQASGEGAIDVLFGRVSPSGKLTETFPLAIEDTPAFNYYPMGPKTVEYRESVYVGYRYYDTAQVPVLFPFGYGLSYTQFSYSKLAFSKAFINDTQNVTVQCEIENSGDVAGAEVVQLYVKDVASTIFRPEKELKGFKKVYLEPGEKALVTFQLSKRAFAYYHTELGDWHVENGLFEILIGSSSKDVRLKGAVEVVSTKEAVVVPNYQVQAPEYYDLKAQSLCISDRAFEHILGRPIPPTQPEENASYSLNSTLMDITVHPAGKALYDQLIARFSDILVGETADDSSAAMFEAMLNEMPLRSLAMFSPDLSLEVVKDLVAQMNR